MKEKRSKKNKRKKNTTKRQEAVEGRNKFH